MVFQSHLNPIYKTNISLGFPGGSAGKESAYSTGDLGLIPGLRRSPGGGNGYPVQCSGLENPMDCSLFVQNVKRVVYKFLQNNKKSRLENKASDIEKFLFFS